MREEVGGKEDGVEEGEELEKEREGGRMPEGGKNKKRVRREQGNCKERMRRGQKKARRGRGEGEERRRGMVYVKRKRVSRGREVGEERVRRGQVDGKEMTMVEIREGREGVWLN